MSSRKKNQDEKNLKLVRELATLSCNKQCFDCRQRGPTYVNMTIGSFVCTTCSGILRGLNPPHRVKSISMTSFNSDDIEFLKTRGNEYCRKVWFGQSDSCVNLGPESKDEQKIKDFMMQVYDKKKWWIDPSTVATKTAQIEQMVISPPPGRVPLSSLLGKSHTPLHVPSVQNNSVPQVKSSSVTTTSQSIAPTEKKLDLLAEFGGDPFSSNTTGNTESNDNFANFDNNPVFSNSGRKDDGETKMKIIPDKSSEKGGTNLTSPAANEPFSSASNLNFGGTATNVNAPSTFPVSNMNNTTIGFPPAPSSNVGASMNTPLQAPSTDVSSSISAPLVTTQFGDRYAALADLDTLFGGSAQSSTWDSTPTSSSSTGWQTTAADVSNTTTSPSASTTMMPTTFGGDPSKPNPFGGGGNSAQMWNQQPVASQFPTQMWNQQQNPASAQATGWNQQIPGQSPAVSSWMTSSSGQVPAQQSWSQQPMPSQAAFSTGNPFQIGQPVPSYTPAQSAATFPSQQNSFGVPAAPFNSGQIGSSTATVPSDANSTFANYNASSSMNSGFAAFPIQNVTSPPDSQNPAQFPVQNGGFRPGTSDGWNTNLSSSKWSASPQQPFQINKTLNNAGVAASSQFASWQQNQGVAPSNPFLGGGAVPSQETPKMNSSNPFL